MKKSNSWTAWYVIVILSGLSLVWMHEWSKDVRPYMQAVGKDIPSYKAPQGPIYKGMDYQEVKRIWLSKGYTIRDAREYNDYNETGEVTLVFPGPVVFNFRWWELQDWSGTNNWFGG